MLTTNLCDGNIPAGDTNSFVNMSSFKAGSHTSFCQRDSVVLQEDDLEAVSDDRVVVDHFANSCDKTDDHLSRVVPRSSLQQRDRRGYYIQLTATQNLFKP